MADEGSVAESGLLHSFIEWPNGCNPAGRLPENGTTLQNIILLHPNPQFITSCIDRIGIDGPIEVRQGQCELIFQLQTSAGELVSLSNVAAQ